MNSNKFWPVQKRSSSNALVVSTSLLFGMYFVVHACGKKKQDAGVWEADPDVRARIEQAQNQSNGTTSTQSSQNAGGQQSNTPDPIPPVVDDGSLASVTASTSVQSGTVQSLTATTTVATAPVVLLDADALKEVLSAVFGPNPRNGETAGGSRADEKLFFNNNPFEYFTPDEKVSLGLYSVASSSVMKVQMKFGQNLTQDYLRALRSFAGRACTKLIAAETATPDASTNRLVKKAALSGTGPSAADIDNFMTAVFGYKAQGGQLHDGSDAYHQLFKRNIETLPASTTAAQRSKAFSDNYNLLCVYVVTDPRVYAR